MTTPGTTGVPKVVPYSLKTLTRSVFRFTSTDAPNWGLLTGTMATVDSSSTA